MNSEHDTTKPVAHTPTPWRILDRNIPFHAHEIVCDVPPRVGIARLPWANEIDTANAELIVRAVNSHADLVEACKSAEVVLSSLECTGDKPLSTGQVLDQLRAALALAKGGDK